MIALLLASSTTFLVALLAGVSPYWFASAILGVSGPNHNLAHLLRAMMCLYFGFGFFGYSRHSTPSLEIRRY
jgi:hypothetical protein